MSDFLSELNESQRVAVEAVEGPVMVIAGAGSGKTRVLTYRVAHLLNLGVDPFNILALTFTNKAAREMKDRIIRLVGSADARNVWMGTFHSVFARVLRSEAHRIGFPSNFSIYDTDDSKRLIKSIIKEKSYDDKAYPPGFVLNRISSAKTSLITAEQYINDENLLLQDKMAGKPLLGEIYKTYSLRLRKASAMDFDDLLLNTFILLRDFPEVLYKYQKRFQFVLVDEYQDTNHVQYMIVKQLAADNENICVVGDDAQSIYAFRGANIQNILNFKRDYPDAREFKLEQNYRSTQVIVKAANSVIAHNKEQIPKEVWTRNDEGDLIRLLKATSDGEEGALVASAIFEERMNRQLPNSAFAVLYRTNAQSRALEEALRKRNIPYRIYGGVSFYNRKEIKDLLAYMRLAVNQNDEEALKRIINYPTRGIGQTTMEKATIRAAELGIPLWQVLSDPVGKGLMVNSGTRNRIEAFITMIRSFAVRVQEANAYDLAVEITRSSGLLNLLREDKTPEGISRYENIEELLNAIKEYTESEVSVMPGQESREEKPEPKTLDRFLQEVALITDADVDENNQDVVSLMTIHAAKGLEFPVVFVVGLEENLFPSMQSVSSRQDLEEERRLFYVAITRAQKLLYLTYAESRYRWGNLIFCEPSRFIDEIDKRYVQFPKRPGIPQPATQQRETSTTLPPMRKKLKKVTSLPPSATEPVDPEILKKIQPGVRVQHARFGEGKVLSVEGNGSSRKAAVFFKTVGQKQLLLKYARLKVLED
ncbi:MAG: 3'-5' exonuclease [Bacteroidales bacterium]